jgi:hypothetical protein
MPIVERVARFFNSLLTVVWFIGIVKEFEVDGQT